MNAQTSLAYSRRRFLQQLLGAGILTVTGIDPLLAQTTPILGAQPLRFAFLTDIHLMKDGQLNSANGMIACLAAVEKIVPRPEFILVGGDLVHLARDLTVAEAERQMDVFLKIWNDHTSLPTHWMFGNHDLVGTANKSVPPGGPHYGKGLFRDRFHLTETFYSFDHKGWHFIVLDDIDPLPDRSYIGRLLDDDIRFLKADLEAHKSIPTIVCAHIPIMSSLPFTLGLVKAAKPDTEIPKTMVCANPNDLFDNMPGHNIRAILSGHLHHYEKVAFNSVPIINSGAVCGHYWKGPMMGCPEGYGVVDLGGDGSVAFDYRDYGWKAAT